MSDREQIFKAIRSALDVLPERTAYPEWDKELVICRAHGDFASLKELFAHKLEGTSARFMDSVEGLASFLKEQGAAFGYCDPVLAGRFQGIEGIGLETEFDESKVNEYAFGITRASCAIAESGTIVLNDGETSSRLGALAPWIHIAVIEEASIVADIPAAIERFGDDPSVIWVTGPSKTADVEGILIEGVHGPGIQIGLVL